MRITYSTIPNGQYSIVALQTPEKMLTFQTLADNDTLAFVKSGTLTAQQIFDGAQSDVITSYSIHYTKLYERFWRRGERRELR